MPKDAAHVYYVAPDGKTNASGATLGQPTTLDSAIERVVTGDAIILRGGTYRTGGLKLNQGITMQPYADEHPVHQRNRGRLEMGSAARQRLAHFLDESVPGKTAELVAA